MKAVIVVDMPNKCAECELHDKDMLGIYCTVCSEKDYIKLYKGIPSWCPLKPIPQKKEVVFSKVLDYQDGNYAEGYNACLDEILGADNE